jgi:hypothetical protein
MCLLVDPRWVQTADAVFHDGEQAWEEHLRSCHARNRLTQVTSAPVAATYLVTSFLMATNGFTLQSGILGLDSASRRGEMGAFFFLNVFLNVGRRQRCWIISKGKRSQLVFTVNQTSNMSIQHPTSPGQPCVGRLRTRMSEVTSRRCERWTFWGCVWHEMFSSFFSHFVATTKSSFNLVIFGIGCLDRRSLDWTVRCLTLL